MEEEEQKENVLPEEEQKEKVLPEEEDNEQVLHDFFFFWAYQP